MHTYKRQDSLYTVGYYIADSEGACYWEPLKDFAREYDAAAYVCFLNGGDGEVLRAARFTEQLSRKLHPASGIPRDEEA